MPSAVNRSSKNSDLTFCQGHRLSLHEFQQHQLAQIHAAVVRKIEPLTNEKRRNVLIIDNSLLWHNCLNRCA